jgi:hypothetical protein
MKRSTVPRSLVSEKLLDATEKSAEGKERGTTQLGGGLSGLKLSMNASDRMNTQA